MPKTVLLCRIDGNFGGVERNLLATAQYLDKNRYRPVVVPINNQAELLQQAAKLGIQTEFLPMPSRFSIAAATDRLLDISRKYKADLIHTFGIRSNTLAYFLRKKLPIPWVVRLPNVNSTDYTNSIQGYVFRWLNNFLIRRADALQVISPQLEAYIRSWKNQPKRLYQIPNGVDTDRFYPGFITDFRKQHSIAADVPIIGSTGRLETIKGYDLLIQSFDAVLKKYPSAVLVLAGEGREYNNLLQLTKDLGIESSVIFTGYSPHVQEILSSLTIFVCSSRSEGVPNSVLEAMGMGLPVIATQVGGMESIMLDNQDGVLIPPGDINALITNILNLLDNPQRRSELGHSARFRVEIDFSVRKMAERVQAMYDEVTEQACK